MLIDGDLAGAIEVRGKRIEVTVDDGPTIRTNHHIALGATASDDNTTTSRSRFDGARTRIIGATSVDDLHDLMRSHDDGTGGICAHGVHQTVYSYVLHHDRSEIALSVTQGPPCEATSPMILTLPIGDSWTPEAAESLRNAYPSATSSNRT